MKNHGNGTPAKTVNKSGSTQPKKAGDAPKVGGSGSTKVASGKSPIIAKGGATNNGGPSKGARGGQK